MVGLESVVNIINSYTLDTLPHSILLNGKEGSGKHVLSDYISDKFNLNLLDITDDLSEDLINNIYRNSSPRLYQIDLRKIPEKDQNILFDIFEILDRPRNALFTGIKNANENKDFVEGGSTITQQVAKNLYFISTDTNSLYRKIAEIFMAYDLEENYNKDDILEFYVNTIYFGDGYYGVDEACNGYFKKSAKDMSLYEATMLAGIPNAPSVYAPTVNKDLALNRQRKVISTMVENEYLTQEQADELIKMQEKETL